MQLISVVLPSYNDNPIIKPYYEAIKAVMTAQKDYDYELIYVDDGSSDGSQATLLELASNDPKVTYVELYRNFGQQRAMFAGLTVARGDYVVTLDGDYQYEPEVILQLVQTMADKFDLASGIRLKRKDSLAERLFSRIGNILIKSILGVPIKDFGSVKAMSRKLVDKILKMKHYFSDVYPSALSLHPGMVEVEVNHRERFSGRSHWNLWMRLRLYVDLYISHGDDQFQTPFRYGILMTLAGPLSAPIMMLYKAILGHQLTYLQMLFIAFIVSIIGLSIAAWALTMSFLIKIYKQNAFQEPFIISHIYRKQKPE